MTAIDVLKEARALLSDPARWTREACAKDAAGGVVNVDNKEAVCFCLIGAVMRVAGFSEFHDAARLLHDLCGSESNAADFNDDPATTHADVLALFDRAIASLESQP